MIVLPATFPPVFQVNERCGPGEVRLASTRECVLPGGYDCTAACGSQGGNLSVELGMSV